MCLRECVLKQNLCGGGNGGVTEAHILMTSPVSSGLLPANIISSVMRRICLYDVACLQAIRDSF